eukprot:sb/3469960/
MLGSIDMADSTSGESSKSTDEGGEFGDFSQENIILYERNSNKKTRGKIVVKPIGSVPDGMTAWAASRRHDQCYTKRVASTTDLGHSGTCNNRSERPKSAQKVRPQTPVRSSSPVKRPSSASGLRPRSTQSDNVAFGRSVTGSRTRSPQPPRPASRSTEALPQQRGSRPSVFDRLYNTSNRTEGRTRRVKSSIQLIQTTPTVPLKTSLVALSTPQLR